MWTIDLASAPPTLAEIREEMSVIEAAKSKHIVMLSTLGLAAVPMAWAYMLLSPPNIVTIAIFAIAGLVSSVEVWGLLSVPAKLAGLQPATPMALQQVPALMQKSPLCAAYVARVAAHKRQLIGREVTAMRREAGRESTSTVRTNAGYPGAA